MQIHIIAETDAYRELMRCLGEKSFNTMYWYEMDESKKITIAGKEFQVKGEVNDTDVYMIRRFRLRNKPTIWLRPYTFPSYFWMTQGD